jgi:Rrf2 family nitric oxide-sensitive transcriptional repressor
MRLNKSTSHAIRILIECARADGALIKVADLAAELGLTMQNVFKMVHIMSRGGLIAATRGRNGGVRLARPAEQIRIGDIVRAMEATDVELDSEGSSRGASGRALQDVNRVFDVALEAFIGVLDQHTLADMANAAPKAKNIPPKSKSTRRKLTRAQSASAFAQRRLSGPMPKN